MQSELDTFTFPKTTRAFYLAGKADYTGWEFKDSSFTALIEAIYQDFPEFLGLHLESDYQKQIDKLKTRHFMPDVEGHSFKGAEALLDEPMYEEFNTLPTRQILRENNQARSSVTYPLTKEELANATDYLSRHAELTDAVLLLQSSLRDYTKKLEMHLLDIGLFSISRIENRLKNPLEKRFSKILGETGHFSFMHDLIPVMAASLSAQNAEIIDANAAGRALCAAFRLHAFKSFNEQETQCPFRSKLNRIFAIDIIRADDGKIQVLEKANPGALIPALISLRSKGSEPNSEHNRDIV